VQLLQHWSAFFIFTLLAHTLGIVCHAVLFVPMHQQAGVGPSKLQDTFFKTRGVVLVSRSWSGHHERANIRELRFAVLGWLG
jgi:hypothetical protein